MDDRRKKLQFRAWRRGFREIDLILGNFADAHLSGMDEAELDEFEALLNAPDQEVYAWITQQSAAPPDYDTPTLGRIRALHFGLNRPTE